jgi:dGTPase
VSAVNDHGEVGMARAEAGALAGLRAFNYERIYVRPASLAQSRAVVEVLRALVQFYAAHPSALPEPLYADPDTEEAVRHAVTYVAGMTDRYAFAAAVSELGWDPERLPRGIDHGH